MDQDEEYNFVNTFDEFYTDNHIQILKAMLPYLGSTQKDSLPVMIKYLELQDAILKQKKGSNPWSDCSTTKIKEFQDFITIYESFKKYLSPSEKSTCEQIVQMKNQLDNIKQMKQMFDLFQDMNMSENGSEENGSQSGSDPLDIMNLLQFMKDIKE